MNRTEFRAMDTDHCDTESVVVSRTVQKNCEGDIEVFSVMVTEVLFLFPQSFVPIYGLPGFF